MEEYLYDHARSLGITIITISQRPGLVGRHTQQLALHGGNSAGWTLWRLHSSVVDNEDENDSVPPALVSVDEE